MKNSFAICPEPRLRRQPDKRKAYCHDKGSGRPQESRRENRARRSRCKAPPPALVIILPVCNLCSSTFTTIFCRFLCNPENSALLRIQPSRQLAACRLFLDTTALARLPIRFTGFSSRQEGKIRPRRCCCHVFVLLRTVSSALDGGESRWWRLSGSFRCSPEVEATFLGSRRPHFVPQGPSTGYLGVLCCVCL